MTSQADRIKAMTEKLEHMPKNTANEAFIVFHKALEGLCRYGSEYSHLGFGVAVGRLTDQRLDSILELAVGARDAFSEPISHWAVDQLPELERSLTLLKGTCRKHRHLMQATVLDHEADNWLAKASAWRNTLRNGSTKPQIDVVLLPSLALDYDSDKYSLSSRVDSRKPTERIAIWNFAPDPIQLGRIGVTVAAPGRLERGGLRLDTDRRGAIRGIGTERYSLVNSIPREFEVESSTGARVIIGRIDGYSGVMLDLPLLVRGVQSGIRITLETPENPGDDPKYELLLAPGLIPRPRAKTDKRSPFVSGRPLKWYGASNDSDSNETMWDAPKLIDALVAELAPDGSKSRTASANLGFLCRITGLDGSGKTSVAYSLFHLLKTTRAPVYVDMALWNERRKQFADSDRRVSVNELLFEWCVKALRDAKDYVKDADEWVRLRDLGKDYGIFAKTSGVPDIDTGIETDWTRTPFNLQVFEGFLLAFAKHLGREEVVFILEGMDIWCRENGHLSEMKELLIDLRALPAPICSFVVIETNERLNWLTDQAAPNYSYSLGFFSRDELFKRLSRWQYAERMTESAKLLIWEYTGGWPEIVQALMLTLNELIQERYPENASPDYIDACDIRQAARSFADETHVNAALLLRLAKSLNQDEISWLRNVVEYHRLDLHSSVIRDAPLTDPMVQRLIKKEIVTSEIQPGRNAVARLRVGLLGAVGQRLFNSGA